MTNTEFLFKIYKKSFSTIKRKNKRPSLEKLKKKINSLNHNINRGVLASCYSDILLFDEKTQKIQDIEKRADSILMKLVERDYQLFRNFYKDVSVKSLFKEDETYPVLKSENLIFYYSQVVIPKNITKEIKDLINKNPEDDYLTARDMKRHFVLHIGPTNSGKTYESLEKLKTCKKGIYLGPLRLLALEVYDKFNRSDVPCNLITGEEELLVNNAVCQASTIEMLNTDDYFDIAVIDEAQMLADPQRGYNWTKAILGLAANEIHVCMAHSAENIVKELIKRCNDTFEVHYHERFTPLSFKHQKFNFDNFHKFLEKGDALIVFSKKSVLATAAMLEKKNIKSSLIYGNLPPDTRKEQVRRFTSGETDIVISTDAIGMGINLPIRRIIFLETYKFDGVQKRILNSQEVKQIAGRAGRKGLYDEGFVLSIDDSKYIEKCLNVPDDEVISSPLGFPEVLIDLPFELNDLIQIWSDVQVDSPFVKMDVSNLLFLYNSYTSIQKKHRKHHSKSDIYRFITCPVDIKDKFVLDDWLKYCILFSKVDEYELPDFFGNPNDLGNLESFYKRLDLYFQFSRKMNKNIDVEGLIKLKKETVKNINNLLKKSLKNFSKKCNSCRKILPANYEYGLCKDCYNTRYRGWYYW